MKKSDSEIIIKFRRIRRVLRLSSLALSAVVAVFLISFFALHYCANGGQSDDGEGGSGGSAISDAADSASSDADSLATNPTESIATDNQSKDEIITNLFENQKSDVRVQGSGTVIRLLEDDDTDGRHQRFILELDNGHTLLVAHNIDIAPRLEGIKLGDRVEFNGEYYYDEEGGGIHWTHRDNIGEHQDGYLKWNGETYE